MDLRKLVVTNVGQSIERMTLWRSMYWRQYREIYMCRRGDVENKDVCLPAAVSQVKVPTFDA